MKPIEIKNLSKNFNQTKALQSLDLNVEEGEIFGFIGPNGAGKSTAIRILLNMIYPTSGTATIFGYDCVTQGREVKKVTSYVSSDVRLYPTMNANEIFKLVSGFHNVQLKETLVSEYIHLFELDTRKKISELSLGNKKKVSLIAALLTQPKLLILDEPTNGLDPLMQHRLFSVLEDMNRQGTTVFLSSHDLQEVQNHCSRAAFIKDGVIVALEAMRTSNEKVITIKGNMNWDVLADKGFQMIRHHENTVDLLTQDPKAILAFLADERVEDFEIRNTTIEDKFIALYERETDHDR